MIDTNVSYVERTPTGGWRIADSRVSLDSIVHAYWEGHLAEAIAADFSTLSLEQIHGAIAFYLRHRDEIDKYLTAQDERWEDFRQESEAKHAPLLKRMRAGVQKLSPSDLPT
jgi:uncharacterized protein (DUF433 family)